MVKVFDALGYLPWRDLDIKTMQRYTAKDSVQKRDIPKPTSPLRCFWEKYSWEKMSLKTEFDHKKQMASLSCEANSVAHFYNSLLGYEIVLPS